MNDEGLKAGASRLIANILERAVTKPAPAAAPTPQAPPPEKKLTPEELQARRNKREKQMEEDDRKAREVFEQFPEYFDRVDDATGFSNLQKVVAYLKIHNYYVTGWCVREAIMRLAEKGQLQTCEAECEQPAAQPTPPAPAKATLPPTPPAPAPGAPAKPTPPVNDLPPLPKWMITAMNGDKLRTRRGVRELPLELYRKFYDSPNRAEFAARIAAVQSR